MPTPTKARPRAKVAAAAVRHAVRALDGVADQLGDAPIYGDLRITIEDAVVAAAVHGALAAAADSVSYWGPTEYGKAHIVHRFGDDVEAVIFVPIEVADQVVPSWRVTAQGPTPGQAS